MQDQTIGTNLITVLEKNGVDFIFGIPGVHTVEIYRGLIHTSIRHITARHEQGAGFMADGYARVTGNPGVCLVISGPGVTNILTPMAQARADSIPMLVISGVNKLSDIQNDRGALHALPDQSALVKQIALESFTINKEQDVSDSVDKAFDILNSGRPGPVHIQLPVDIMNKKFERRKKTKSNFKKKKPSLIFPIDLVNKYIFEAEQPVIIIGGGCRNAKNEVRVLAEKLGAPVISTTNARDLLGTHPLHIPASPSLSCVRELIRNSDLVIVIGSEMGMTDYDFYEDRKFPRIKKLLRVDLEENSISDKANKTLNLRLDSKKFCKKFIPLIKCNSSSKGVSCASEVKRNIKKHMSKSYKNYQKVLESIVKTLPNSVIVGDSTQLTYAGNFYCEISEENRWFNSATGFGTLGFGPPAAIGAKLGNPDKPVVCIVGDGGIQFSLSELGTAVDENTPVIFLIWNNKEYKEIRTFMEANDIHPIGTSPSPPNFKKIATAFKIFYQQVSTLKELKDTLQKYAKSSKSVIIEILEQEFFH